MKNLLMPRRTFLRGAGYALALPLLEAMMPSFANAAAKPLRFMAVYFGNGVYSDGWYPTGNGTSWATSPGLSPLEAVRPYIMPVMGLHNEAVTRGYQLDGGGAHWYGATSFLTGQHYDFDFKNSKTALAIPGGSLDQLYGSLQSGVKLPALVMGSGRPDAYSNGDSRGLGSFVMNVAYKYSNLKGVDQCVPHMASSRDVFRALFGDGSSAPQTPSATSPSTRREFQKTILDYVLGDVKKLNSVLGSADKAKLDEYLTQVETVQKNIATEPIVTSCNAPTDSRFTADADPYNQSQLTPRVINMIDLAVLAFQCDLTRSIVLQIDSEHNFQSLNDRSSNLFPGITYESGDHHSTSHYAGNDALMAQMINFHKWHSNCFANLITKLQGAKEGSSSILDQSLVMYGTGLGDSNNHSADNVPLILAGKAGGALNPGRLVRVNGSQSNMLLTLGQKLGMTNLKSMGFSDGLITGV